MVGQWADGPERGQGTLIGTILMVGLVLVGATITVLVGGAAVNDLQRSAQGEQARTSMSQLDAQVSAVAYGSDSSRRLDTGLDLSGDGSMRYEDIGTVRVRTESGDVLLEPQTMGAIVYEDSGTSYAYQGGGVWQGTGEESRMVSPPEFHFRSGTVTMPLIRMDAESESLGSSLFFSRGTYTGSPASPSGPRIEQYDSRTSESGHQTSYRIRKKKVQVFIEGPYYAGWAEYFRDRVSDVTVKTYASNETTRVTLGQLGGRAGISEGVLAMGGNVEVDKNGAIDGPVSATGEVYGKSGPDVREGVRTDAYSLNRVIDEKISDVDGSGSEPDVHVYDDSDDFLDDVDGADRMEGGHTYLVKDDLTFGSETVEVDLSGGQNVSLLVDGNVVLDSSNAELKATGASADNPDTALRLYTTGDLSLRNGKILVGDDRTDPGARHMIVYGTNTTEIGILGGTTEFEGVVYAPREDSVDGPNDAYDRVGTNSQNKNKCGIEDGSGGNGNGNRGGGGGGTVETADFCVATGSSTVRGAFIGASAKASQSTEIEYDEALADSDLIIDPGELVVPPIAHLHVSITEVEADSD